MAHVQVAVLCPAIAAISFMLLDSDRGSLLQLRGLWILVVTIFCAYLFFGFMAVMAVIAISPFMWMVSKTPRRAGSALALIVGAGAGWLICQLSVNDIPAFQFALAATSAFAAAGLEKAWRRTYRIPGSHF